MPKTWLQQKDQQVQKKIKVWKFTPTHILTHCLWVCNFLKIDLLVPTELFHHVVNDALNFIVFFDKIHNVGKIFQVFDSSNNGFWLTNRLKFDKLALREECPQTLFWPKRILAVIPWISSNEGSFTQWVFNQCQNLPISSEIGQNMNEIYVNLCPKICQRCHENIRRRLWSGMLSTVWKILYFSITYILREINFGDSRSTKCAIFTHLEALNFDFWYISALKNCSQFNRIKIQSLWKCNNGRFLNLYNP